MIHERGNGLDRIAAPPYLCHVPTRVIIASSLALLLLVGAAFADAPLVEDTHVEVEQALADLERSPRDPETELAILDIADHWDTAGPPAVIAALEKALALPRLDPAARERARRLLALARLRTGDPAAAQADADRRGFIADWRVIGPFDNEGATGFDTPYEPEALRCDAPDPAAAEVTGVRGPLSWRTAPAAAVSFGRLHLEALTEPDTSVCFYALATVESQTSGSAVLRIGGAGAVKALWNGRQAVVDDAYRGDDPDRFAAAVAVRKGANRLLAKVCSDETGQMGLYARLTDRSYEPWPSAARAAAAAPLPCAPARRDEAGPRPLPTPLQRLVRRAEAPRASAADKAAASDYLDRTNATHLATHQARDFAREACEASGSPSHCLLWSDLALDRNERRVAIGRALESDPDSSAALLALADVELDGPDPSRARALAHRVLEVSAGDLDARLLTLEIDAAEGLPLTALARAEEIVAALPGVPAPVLLAHDLAEQAGAASLAIDLASAVLESSFDDLDLHVTLARAAAARGDIPAFTRHRDAILALACHDASALFELASLTEGIGDLDGAEELLARAIDLAPDDASALKTLGDFLLRNDRRDEGLAALARARAIAPQDAWLADYLELLDPAPRFEEPYVVPPEEFLAGRGALDEGEDARFLVDCTVVRVFDSGLASRFEQLVVEIGSRAAAREWRQHAIQYSSDSERVVLLAARVFRADGSVEQSTGRGTVPIAEPWYRLYYDVEAEVVELPPLEPGDVLELRYRLDDTAQRNAFADYFGDLVLVNDAIGKDLWRYVLVMPRSREVVFAEPAIDGLVRESEADADSVVELFEAHRVPPVHRERHMPGDTAGAAYVHLSTYDSWDALGRWYRGLIRNQLLPDARIAGLVKELTAGLRDERAKVRAIYGWVVTATRYVGLEFGIHGYKPYRAPLVVARGFGDCKDKASLLVTMLREAGIDADLALVRTRSAGAIRDAPASLSVFNHAIAYVPSLDLWLDGTAEQHGTSELPFEDQGVIALRLSRDRAVLGRTSILNADRSVFDERLEVLLDADGEARFEARTRVLGAGAPPLRTELEAERTRRERFEASLVTSYPGARLGDLAMEGLSDIESPVSYEFTAFIPGFGRVVSGEIELPVDSGLDLAASYCKLSRREHDLVTGPKRTLNRAVEIEIPTGYEPSRIPSTTVIESRYGKLRLELEIGDGKIRVQRTFELDVDEVPVADYSDFCSFARRVDEALEADITLARVP